MIKDYYKKVQPWAVVCLKRDDFKCTKCKVTKSLLVHHLDESRKNGIKSMNNNLDNLITLCKKCHAIIHGQNKKFSIFSKYFKIVVDLRKKDLSFGTIGRQIGLNYKQAHYIYHKALKDGY